MANSQDRVDELQEHWLNKAIAAARGIIEPGVARDRDSCDEGSSQLNDLGVQCLDEHQPFFVV